MSHPSHEFAEALAIRRETLSLVAQLDQKQADFQEEPGTWSVGEVLDHLLRLDALMVREIELTINQRRRGLPFVYRGIADIDTSIPWVLRPILPLVEVPFSFVNVVFPQAARRAFTGNRSIPLQAPGALEPRFGRPIETLRAELSATFTTLAEQQAANADINFDRVFYYNPLAGLSSVNGMYRFVSNHEKRHQGQMRDILGNQSFPRLGLARSA